jgi:hypothetical protein
MEKPGEIILSKFHHTKTTHLELGKTDEIELYLDHYPLIDTSLLITDHQPKAQAKKQP